MGTQTALLARKAQMAAMADTLGVVADPLDAWTERHADTLPTNLRVTVDSRFDRLTFATRCREREAFPGLLAASSSMDLQRLAAGLDPVPTRMVAMLGLGRKETWTGLGLGGAWDLDVAGAAWRRADLPAWAEVERLHAEVDGGSIGAFVAGPRGLSIAFGVAVPDEKRADMADLLVAAAGRLGTSYLQRGLLRGMLETWTPRALNHLSLRLHWREGAWVPGLDVAFLDVPSPHVVVGLQTGQMSDRSGTYYGIIEGTLMPDRPGAIEVVFETGPDEPAIVSATLESSGVEGAR